MKVSFDAPHGVIWSFPGTDLAPVALDLTKVHPDNRAYAMLHGFNQRCSDNAAGAEGAAAKRAAVAEMVEWYESGAETWDRPRVGGGPRFDIGAVVAALANTKFSGDVDRANRAIDATAAKRNISRDDAAKLYANDPDIAVAIARAKAMAKPAAFDVDAEIETI